MSNLFVLPKQVPLTIAGKIYPGAKAYFYRTGTSNAKNTYSDAALTTPNSNPVVADAGGTFPTVFLDTSVEEYRLTLKTSADVLIYTQDNLGYQQIGQSQFNAFLALSPPYATTPRETSLSITVVNKLYPEGDLRRYGGIGDSTTDDSVALQRAITLGLCIVPDGYSFKIVTPATKAGTARIYGFGPASKLIGDGFILQITAADDLILDNLSFENITAPLTIQRRVETTVNTTATLTSGNAVVVVASAVGIVQGMQVFGFGMKSGVIVTFVAGTNITLSSPAQLSDTVVPLRFFRITFNTGAAAVATLAASNASGRYSVNINDQDVWPGLTAPQQASAQIGPVVQLTGDRIVVTRLNTRHASIQITGSECKANNNKMRGGWTYGAISFLNFSATMQTHDNEAIGNQIEDHAFNGILFMGCDGCTMVGNSVLGVGESCYKLFSYVDGATSQGCSRPTSSGNRAVAGYQGAFDFQSFFVPVATPSISGGVMKGDYAAWHPFGAIGVSGRSWDIDVVAEFNLGPVLLANVDDSKIAVQALENNFASLNAGAPNTIAITGKNNLIHDIRHKNLSAGARPGYAMVVSGGTAFADINTINDCDFKDAVTAAGSTFQFLNYYKRLNLRGNGVDDFPPASLHQTALTYSASMTPDFGLGDAVYIEVTNNTAFTINAPTNIAPGQVVRIQIFNLTGGAIGVATFAAFYKLTAWVQPGTGQNRTIVFMAIGNAAAAYEQSRTADVPN